MNSVLFALLIFSLQLLFTKISLVDCELREQTEINEQEECLVERKPRSSRLPRSFVDLLPIRRQLSALAQRAQMSKECLQAAFDQIDDKFDDIKDQIGHLQSNINLRNSLTGARTILDGVHFVFAALKLYLAHNESSAWTEASEQCRLHSPRNSLIALKNRATTPPRLFDEILSGTQYTQVLFKKMSAIWLEEAGLCALLAQECDRILHHGASTSLAKERERAAAENLDLIEDAFLAADRKLKEDFKNVVATDIREALRIMESKGYGRKQTARFIHNHLSTKFPFREWAVLVYNKIAFNQYATHVHEGSMDNWFFVEYRRYTVIAHSSDNSMNCSFFEMKLTNKTLSSFLNPDVPRIFSEEYASMLSDEGHLYNDLNTLRRVFQEQSLPQSYFFSVIRYQPSLTVRRGTRFHYVEHLRHPHTGQAKKTILIGWC